MYELKTRGIYLKIGTLKRVPDMFQAPYHLARRKPLWRVRLRKDGTEGTVPSCYLEKKTTVTPPMSPQLDAKAQATIARREKVLKELVESEEAFARDMQYVVNNYIKEMDKKSMPKDLRDSKDVLFTNFAAISEFHNNVLMKGIQYYADDPSRLGKTFLRLERDFDQHVSYCRDEPEAQHLLQEGPLKEYFDEFSKKIEDEKTLSEHLKLPIQRINDYQLLLKELIKYTARLREDTTDLEKAHDFMQAIPQRIADLQYINSIQGYKGNLHKLGRILKHDWFEVTDGHNLRRERLLFLFKGRIFVTDHKRVGTTRSIYLVKHVIKLPEVEIVDCADDDDLKLRFQSLKSGMPGFPFTLKSKTIEQKEEWLKAIQESSGPHIEDLGDEELDQIEDQATKIEEFYEKHETKVEVVEDFEAYEEMQTVITESVRSGSLTSLEEGVEAVLECEVCASPDVNVAWLKDNSPLASSRRALLEADGGKHRLLIKKTECADSGLYTIIASNVHGTTSCSAPLTVSSAPGTLPPVSPDGTPLSYGPIFREKLRDTELQEGTDFRVCVIVEGEPKSELKFFKNEEEIGTTGRIRYHKENDDCYELIIDKVEKDDAGKFSCVAKSSAGQNVTACDIAVTSSKVFVKVDEDPDKTSTPDLTDNVQWAKDNVEVDSERFKVSIDEAQDTVSLMFQHVTPDDAGMYTCVASTSSGKISCSAELTVQGVFTKINWRFKSKDGEELKLGDKYVMLQEDDETFTMAIKDVSADDSGKYCAEAINDMGKDEVTYDVRITSPPKFLKQMKGSSVLVGEDIEFTVEVDGTPEPTVTWSKDGQTLSPSERIKITSDGKVKKLVIKNATVEDAGNYSCIIKNENGSQGGFGAVQVNSPAKFVKGLNDAAVTVGENVEFSVTITGNPTPTLRWLKDGKDVKIDDSHIVQRKKSDTSYTLIIKETTTEDIGEYSCEIVNEHGKDTSKGSLKLKEKLGFKKGLKDIQVSEGEDFELTVNISGTPKPKVKWSKDGSDLTIDGEHVEFKKEEAEDSLTVIVHKSTTEDSGSYKCTITNSEGSETTESKVTVKEEVKAPTFTKELKDVTVTEGETVEFSVKFTGKPKVKWTKGDAELKIDSKHFEYKKEEADDSLTIILHDAKPEDTGKYSCILTNSAGSVSTSSNVKVTAEEKAPTFQKGLKDITVKEDETVNFTVKFSGKPKPSAKWDKDGAELTIDNKHFELRYEEAEDSLTLVLNKATKEDAGTYGCTISNSVGSEKTTSKLEVTETETSASVTKKLKDITSVEEETVELTVEYEGVPKPETKWQKDGKDIKIDDDHFELTKEDRSETLTINEVTKEDAGEYSCTVTNSAGSESTKSVVTVKEDTSSPKFVKGLKDQSAKEEQTVKFTVKFTGKPKPTVKWTKDDAELTIDGKHVQSIEEAEDSLTIVLKDTKIADSGKYSCTITNSEGSDTTTSKLTVSEATSSPEFTQKLKDRDVKEGSDAEFTVKFTGKPKPTAKWTFDSADLTIDNTHTELKIEEDGDSLTLIIHGATKEDAGKYSCTISNSLGSQTSSGKLSVSVAPQFVKTLEDIEAEEGASLRLNIKFEGQPEPKVVWKKDGKVLEIDGKTVKTSIESDDSITLIIDKLKKEDVGKYTCEISNAHGSASTSGNVTVTGKPVIKKGLENKEVTVGDTNVELVVEAKGTPAPDVKWFLNGKELSESDSYSISSDAAKGIYKLVLKKVTNEMAGEIKFEASNPSGKADCKGTISLLKKPSFLKDLADVSLLDGDTLKLETAVDGAPAPTVKWYKGKKELSSEDVNIKSEGSNHSLVIDETTIEDSGAYICKAKNKVGEATQQATVTVKSRKDTQAPMFITHLYDQTIVVDDSGRLEAKITGKPDPEVTWYRGEEELKANEKTIIKSETESNTYTLTLRDLKIEDTAKYTCKAVNKYGEAQETAQITIKEPVAPHIEELEDVEVRYGAPARLKAKISGFPKPDVKWSKDGNTVKASDLFEISANPESKNYALAIKSVKSDEVGRYSCVASNQAGETNAECSLSIKAQLPVFVREPKDQSLDIGEEFKFEAEVHGYPSLEITWLKDNKPIETNSHLKTSKDGDIYKLVGTIKGVEDAGIFTCKAANKAGEDSRKATLKISAVKVSEPGKKPVIVKELKAGKVLEGDEAKLQVVVSGQPMPTVAWMHNGRNVMEGQHCTPSMEDNGLATLTIHEVKCEDGGMYTVIAANNLGKAVSEAPIIVTPRVKIDTEKKPTKVFEFLKSLMPQLVPEGKPCTLEAQVTTDPKPISVKWTKDGKEIPPSERLQISEDANGTLKLCIANLTPADRGKYAVIVSDGNVEIKSEAMVNMLPSMPGMSGNKPAFIKGLEPLKVNEGETIKLKAELQPDTGCKLKWMKDGDDIVKNDRTQILEQPNGAIALIIEAAVPEDSGKYVVIATNDEGKTRSSAMVAVVGDGFKLPEIVESLKPASFVQGEPGKLTAKIDGEPKPDVKWLRDGVPLEPSDRIKMSQSPDGTVTLDIADVKPEDAGKYTLLISNVGGEMRSSANVEVIQSPLFLKPLEAVTGVVDCPAKLECKISGDPIPDIKWTKDGNEVSDDDPNIRKRQLPSGEVALVFDKCKPENAGDYTCTATNKHGEKSCSAPLKVISKDIEGQHKSSPSFATLKVYRCNPRHEGVYECRASNNQGDASSKGKVFIQPHTPPKFIERLSDMQFLANQPMKLMCRVEGVPDPVVDWYFNRNKLDSGVKYSILREGDKCILTVPHPRPADSGIYECRATNEVGKDSCNANIAVSGADTEGEPAMFLKKLKDSSVLNGMSAKLTACICGTPKPEVKWFKDGTQLSPDNRLTLEADPNGVIRLIIRGAQRADAGTYRVSISNKFGSDTCTAVLGIEGVFKDGTQLSPDNRLTLEADPNGVIRLIIRGAQRADAGTYRVSISNKFGSDTCTAVLGIEGEDKPTKPEVTKREITKPIITTATNIAGTATTSAMLNVEECENEYHILTYKRPPFSKPNERPFEDFYDIGDELGRGTQGITYHVVERKTGRSLAAKVMHGTDKLMDFMTSEMDIMNQLCHPRLVRLWDAHKTKSSLTLATDLCGGGELLPNIIHRGKLTESIVAHYIKQVLEGLQHMHEKNIAHLGLTIGDVLLTRLNCDNIKIADFGLATRLYSGREFIQEYGHPEFVAPEIANKQPVSLAADMWSVGIIAYILLVGESPFLRENDRETLKEVQRGMPNFFHDNFAVLSDDARDFVAQLLQSDPSKRLDVNAALKHKWLNLDSVPDICDELEIIDNLRDYYKKWRSWYSNASCRWFFRRRTLESCFTHPSRMIYPPNEEYTPPATPDRELDRSRVKPAAFDDVTFRQRIEREAIDPRSESQCEPRQSLIDISLLTSSYQNGPDTFLLPLRDPDFPVRIRRYLKVGANRSPILANHLRDKHWGYSDVAVKERRKFVDVMDEEIDDEKKGVSQSANLRLRHEVGTVGSGYEHLETRSQKKRRGFRGTAGTAPFFREKIKHAVVRENEDAEFQCRVTASPEAQVSWFRNDGILIESSRIIINKWSDGRCSLTLRPAKAYDVGVYKCVARNSHGVSVSRARLNLGSVSGKPDLPKAEKVSDTEVFLTWMPPRFDGYSPTFGYALECKEEGSEAWTKVANNISHEFYLVRDLKPATTYYFHVCAVNKFGWSEFGTPSEPIMTLAESAPKIELGRAEKFQQDQTDSGQELILDSLDQVKLDYGREDEPVVLEEAQPTDLYNYISEVAKGRFSLVMKVWHKKVNGTFVGKACDLTGADGAAAHKEFEIYSSLQHEKIANLHSASVSKSNMFFIMEKLSGLDVISYLSMRPLYTEEIVSKIIHQVIDALEYLHFRGICYFELQPDNVVMEDRHNPNIKLVDFGSAQFVPEEGAKVQVHGNPEYLAPEVLKGEEVHTPADIWGVGVLTYILLSGVSPFAGDSDKETRDNVLYVRYHFDHLYKEATPEATHFLMQLFKRTPQQKHHNHEGWLDSSRWAFSKQFLTPVPYPSHLEISVNGVQLSRSWSSSTSTTHRFLLKTL
ncbi:obscurin [Trichonephila inaurata madagascariensis]|uniref:Obscurin n=1 Tax=Trichonephila inaurata madagascariensis TaxID=2747483 RepID=A0A8X6XD09_9ARAC|nr:obscurin [Trichonephila inaurata madagascariensis]